MTDTVARRSPPNMQDVADVAGVSHQTVSRVLNGFENIRPETRDRVLAAISQLGYRRNAAARVLATSRTHAIGVLAPASSDYGPTSAVQSLERAARLVGYHPLVTTTPTDRAAVFSSLGLPARPGGRGARGDRAAHPRAGCGARARPVAADRDAAVHRARLRDGHLDRPARRRPDRDGAPARTRPPPHPARRRTAGVLRGRRPPARLRGVRSPRRASSRCRSSSATGRPRRATAPPPRSPRMRRPSSAGTTRWRSG